MIEQARQDFDTWFAAHTGEGPEFNQRVRVTGVGMFDRWIMLRVLHPMALNCIQ